MSDEVELSGLARRILERMRTYPENHWYDTRPLGGMFRPSDLDHLDGAYQELRRAGFVEPSGDEYSFHGHRATLYQLSAKGRTAAGSIA